MNFFRAFLLYDFSREQFYLSLRSSIEFDSDWVKAKAEIQSQIKEQNVLEEKEFQCESNIGQVRGKFDFITKRLLILVSHYYVDDIFQAELLHQIYAQLIENPNYMKINVQELEIQEKFKIEKIMRLKEQQLVQQRTLQNNQQPKKMNKIIQSNKKIVTNTTLSSEDNEMQSSQRKQVEEENQKAFRGFLMYDYSKQYFFMFVRKNFNSDKSWTQERSNIEKVILERKKSPPSLFSIEGQFGQFILSYDAEAKIYFILLSSKKTAESAQSELIQKIKGFVTVEPKYYMSKKSDLEYQFLYAISDVIDAEERIYQQKYGKKSISLNVISQKQMISINVLPDNSPEDQNNEKKEEKTCTAA